MKTLNLIILHGWGSNPTRWQLVQNKLSRFVTVHVPFLPGFDKENPLTKPFTVEDYSNWLDKYIQENKLSNVTLAGHSHGGRIAMHYAATHKNVIQKLILINAAGINPKNTIKKAIFKYIATIGKTIFGLIPNKKVALFCQKVLYKIAGESDYLTANPVMKETLKNVLAFDIAKYLKNISCPTLCIWGKRDNDTPLWMGEIIVKNIPKARLITIDAGHNLHITHPNEINNLITDFITNV